MLWFGISSNSHNVFINIAVISFDDVIWLFGYCFF